MNTSIPDIAFEAAEPRRFHEQTVESLRAQLANYKVRCTALEEIVKNINMDHSAANSTFYQQLLKLLGQDEQYRSCQEQLDALREEHSVLQRKYAILQDDYQQTLNMTDEHLKDHDTLNNLCNTILDQFIVHSAPHLQDIKDRDSAFINLKLQTINDEVANWFKHNKQGDDSILHDDKLNNLFDFLQEQYEKFIKDINNKLAVSLNLQNLIQDKFEQQKHLHARQLELMKKSNNKIHNSHNQNRRTLSNTQNVLDNLPQSIGRKKENSIPSEANTTPMDSEISDSDNETKILPIIESSKIFSSNDNYNSKLVNLENLLLTLSETLLEKESHDKLPLNEITEQIKTLSLQNYHSLQSNIDNKLSQLTLPQDLIHHLTQNLNDIKLQLNSKFNDSNKQLELIKSLKSDNENLLHDLQREQLTISKNELNLISFQKTISIHLKNIFHILSKILQQDSIDHSFKKLRLIDGSLGQNFLKNMEPKFESLLQFIESALESIINSYIKLLIATNTSPLGEITSQQQIDNQLRIDELQRRWQMEREKRKLDQKVAETRIDNLEQHLRQLQTQIRTTSHQTLTHS